MNSALLFGELDSYQRAQELISILEIISKTLAANSVFTVSASLVLILPALAVLQARIGAMAPRPTCRAMKNFG